MLQMMLQAKVEWNEVCRREKNVHCHVEEKKKSKFLLFPDFYTALPSRNLRVVFMGPSLLFALTTNT